MNPKKKPCYTNEQVAILVQNPYTHTATAYRLTFTLEFKEYFIDQVGSGESILLGMSVINSKKVLMIELKEWQIENVLSEDEE